jgi:hypothetical protein
MIDSRYFINKFPKLNAELSYETILHKKVQSDLYMLIPTGIKAFAWFTFYGNKNICVILHLNKYNYITNVEETILSFDKKLSYGTIIYGTYFTHKNMKYFTCEDILYYKGNDIYNIENNKKSTYIERLQIMKNIFDSELQQIAYTDKFIIFGLPVFTNMIKDAFAKISSISYNINGIVCRNYQDINAIGIILNKITPKIESIFKIKADIRHDIYNLYCRDNKSDFYNSACIPDYKTSVMMNNIFRHIKENKRLDLLEESDDDDEFENINEDKFVNLKKIVYMKCIYMKKFRKWMPVEEVKYGEKLLTKNDIKNLERN